MAKTKISEYSATANSNTDVASINIDEGCAPSGINNAIRAVMGHLKDFQQGTNGDPFNGPVNGTVGATTPSTGAFTTLSSTGNSYFATSSGSVGIGTSSPAYKLDLLSATSGNIAKFKSSGSYGTVVADNGSTTGGGSFSVWKNGSQIGAFASDGAIQGNTSSDIAIFADTGGSLRFYTNGSATAKAVLNTSGGLQTLNTVGVGNTTPSTSGAGITFPATQSSSSNVNTLDDYEEGTFTPTCALATPGTSATTSAVGFYTKVGNLVTVVGRLTFTKGTGSGDLTLGGLPFATTSTAQYQSSGALSLDTVGVTGKVYYIILVNNSTAPILISVTQSGGVAAQASVSDLGTSGAGIRYVFSYQTD